MSIQVKELAFVFHPVTDIPRARKFYEDLLGLKTGVQVEFRPVVD
jgi:extradiol dioxygenase family protein